MWFPPRRVQATMTSPAFPQPVQVVMTQKDGCRYQEVVVSFIAPKLNPRELNRFAIAAVIRDCTKLLTERGVPIESCEANEHNQIVLFFLVNGDVETIPVRVSAFINRRRAELRRNDVGTKSRRTGKPSYNYRRRKTQPVRQPRAA